jgi:hypothetical protein
MSLAISGARLQRNPTSDPGSRAYARNHRLEYASVPDPYVFGQCDVERLRFDAENPRLPLGVNGADDVAVLSWMLGDAGLLEILASMGAQGFFPGDPLLVCPWPDDPSAATVTRPEDGGEWTVVEGNRRLAALRLFRSPDSAPRRRRAVANVVDQAAFSPPSSVPVVAFPKRDSILIYLGFRHITGVKDWDPLEKARYLTQLRDRARAAGTPSDNRTLARFIGSKGPYVGRLLAAYAAMLLLIESDVLRETDEDDVPFSLLALSLNYTNLISWLGLENADDADLAGLKPERLMQLGTWLYQEREDGQTALEESRNMRLLAKVVTNEEAITALEEGRSIRDAALLAEPEDAVFAEALHQAAGRMEIASAHASRVSAPSEESKTHLVSIREQAEWIESTIAGE